jgi:Ca2+-binding EF-hand superfamily protein
MGKEESMKKLLLVGVSALALGLSAQASWAQGQRKPGDMPGPIDNLSDLQDTGRMLFKLADENNDGQISQKEAIDAGNLLVGGFFFRADQNGDGKVDQNEGRQAREAFLSTKPWLKYAVETAKATRQQQGSTNPNNPNANNPIGALANALDTNNDKALDATELRAAVQSAVQGVFATADTNRDGQLSPAELNAAIAGAARTVAQAAFQQADTDNNGQLSQAEFEKAIIGPARTAFAIMDLNHDGQLSQQEAQTARQVIISRIQMLRVPEPANSPRNVINSTLGTPTQPAAPTTPPSQP